MARIKTTRIRLTTSPSLLAAKHNWKSRPLSRLRGTRTPGNERSPLSKLSQRLRLTGLEYIKQNYYTGLLNAWNAPFTCIGLRFRNCCSCSLTVCPLRVGCYFLCVHITSRPDWTFCRQSHCICNMICAASGFVEKIYQECLCDGKENNWKPNLIKKK